MIKDNDFCSVVSDVWKEVYPILTTEWMNYLEACFAPYEEAYKRDKQRWPDETFKPLHSVVEELCTSLRRNVEWFHTHLPPNANSITSIVPTDGRHIVYTMSGQILRISDNYGSAIRNLPRGVYIVDNKKVVVL